MKFRYLVRLDAKFSFISTRELEAVIGDNNGISMKKISDREIVINSDADLSKIFLRLASVKEAYLLISDISEIEKHMSRGLRSRLGYYIPYTISILNFHKNPREANSMLRKIVDDFPWIKISLNSPQLEIRLFGENLGIKLPVGRDIILNRDPKYRPYAPPAAMESLLSRVLVNLTGIRSGGVFLDPFCGTGSIALEAAEIGMRVICIDINPRAVEAAMMLLHKYYGHECVEIRVGDARNLPFADRFIDGIATDPPYGISSPTFGVSINKLYEDFLSEARRILKPRAKLVICHTPSVPLREFASKIGLEYEHEFSMRIHSKLWRIISILRAG